MGGKDVYLRDASCSNLAMKFITIVISLTIAVGVGAIPILSRVQANKAEAAKQKRRGVPN